MAVKKTDHRRKLTDKQRSEIIIKFSEGISKRVLADEYQVRRYTISTVINPELVKQDYEKRKAKK